MSSRRAGGSAGTAMRANLAGMTDTAALPEPPAPRAAAESPEPAEPAGPTEPGQPSGLEQLRAGSAGTLIERMGIDLVEATPARVVATMPVAGNTQPYGLLHGGASVVLAETVGSFGAMLHAGAGRRAVGIEVSASHHRSPRTGRVTATATAVHLGRSTASYAIVLEDEKGTRVCTARLTCMLLDGPGAPGTSGS